MSPSGLWPFCEVEVGDKEPEKHGCSLTNGVSPGQVHTGWPHHTTKATPARVSCAFKESNILPPSQLD